jgi:hypothetical protein
VGVFGDYQYMEDGDWKGNLIDPAAQIEDAMILVNKQQKPERERERERESRVEQSRLNEGREVTKTKVLRRTVKLIVFLNRRILVSPLYRFP